MILIVAVTAGCSTTATTPLPALETPGPPVPAAVQATSTTCATSAILVNSCRPWSGGDIRWIDVPEGRVPPAGKEDPYLLLNWRPAQTWAEVTHAHVDGIAAGIRLIAPRKVFLALHHAPEVGVTTASGCDTAHGAAGTPAEYRQMWKRVRERFDALGVMNVVWVMGYANQPGWDCLVPELYPGDRYVDWIVFGGDPARFQRVLTGMNGPDRQVLTKPWGLLVVSGQPSPAKALTNLRAYISAPG